MMNPEIKTDVDFKHDTDNLTVFTVILFSVAGVMFIIAVCLIVFRVAVRDEMDRKIINNPSLRNDANLQYAKNRLHPTREIKDSYGALTLTWKTDIDTAMKSVVQEQAK